MKTKYLLYILLYTQISYAQFEWEENGKPIRQGYHIEWYRGGDLTSNNDLIIVWSDTRSSSRDVYAQKVNSSGDVLWDEGGVLVSGGSGRQEDPIVIADQFGGAYITWRNYDNDPIYGEIYAGYIDDEGDMLWTDVKVSGDLSIRINSQQNMCVDNGNSGAYVTWYEDLNAGDGNYWGSHLNYDGSFEGPYQLINTNQNYGNVSLESAYDGDAVIVWKEGDFGQENIYAQRISVNNNNLETLWSPLTVSTAEGTQTSPKVTYYDQDYVVLVWEDHSTNNYAIGANFIDDEGQLKFQNGNDIVYTTDASSPLFPRVKAPTETPYSYVVWLSADDIHYVQKLTPDNLTNWNEPISLETGQKQQQARLSASEHGVFVAWEDGEFEDKSIATSFISREGELLFSKTISDIDSEQFSPLVRTAGGGMWAYIVWGDGALNSNGIGSLGFNYQFVGDDGNTAFDNNKEIFYGYGGQIEKGSTKSIQFNDNSNLIYWQDYRNGTDNPQTFGTLIDSGGQSYEHKLSEYSNKQFDPQIVRIDANDLFLSFYNFQGTVYYQLINNNLESLGQALPVYDNGNEQASSDRLPMIFSSGDGFVYYGYSQSDGIYMQKYDALGNELWDQNKLIASNSGDNIINKIFYSQNGELVILHDNRSFFAKEVRTTKLSENGDVIENWDNQIISSEGMESVYQNSIQISNGAFLVWYDDDDKNIYGLKLLFDSDSPSTSESVNISSSGFLYTNTITLDYNIELNEIFICWQEQVEGVYNIQCSSINLENMVAVSPDYVYQDNLNTQKNPIVKATEKSTYFVSWEDERQGNYSDLFIQELNTSGQIFLENDGEELCSEGFNQYNRGIESISNQGEYVAFWEDDRSSGKEFVTNIFAQKLAPSQCPSLGDVNGDGGYNVLDIVMLANCVLSQNCSSIQNGCAADMNGDGGYNVLDIVTLANCVLSQSCNN